MALDSRPGSRPRNGEVGRPRILKAYGFGIVTAGMFLLAWSAQFVAQAMTLANEAHEHGQQFSWGDFWPAFLASTFENWQSEFLQLIWQAAGLALLFMWGSSQSREGGERIEGKLDRLLIAHGIQPEDVSREVNESL